MLLAQEATKGGGQEEIPAWNRSDEVQPKIGSNLSPD